LPAKPPSGENELVRLRDHLRAALARASEVETVGATGRGMGFLWRVSGGAKLPNAALMWIVLRDALEGVVDLKPECILYSEVFRDEVDLLTITLEVDTR
jgi:hypothetical protein